MTDAWPARGVFARIIEMIGDAPSWELPMREIRIDRQNPIEFTLGGKDKLITQTSETLDLFRQRSLRAVDVTVHLHQATGLGLWLSGSSTGVSTPFTSTAG